MAKLHVTQIGGHLDKIFAGKIDMTDWVHHKDGDQIKAAFLSRALAAYAILMLTQADETASAASVTDGGQDCGIDAIYFEPTERVLYIVQSKWSADGTSTIDQGDIQKYLNGVRALLDADFAKFNAKINARKQDIERALYDAAARFCLVLVHTGQADLGKEVRQDLDQFIASQNDTSELLRSVVIKQGELHHSIATGKAGAPIDTDIQLFEWGQVKEPFHAVYGQILATDMAALYTKHGSALFAPNLRVFLGSTEPNDDIVATAVSEPMAFWYFNNGITALCKSLNKKPIGGNSHEWESSNVRDSQWSTELRRLVR